MRRNEDLGEHPRAVNMKSNNSNYATDKDFITNEESRNATEPSLSVMTRSCTHLYSCICISHSNS